MEKEKLAQVQRGFNDGYILEKNAPDLSRTLIDGFEDKNHPYAIGFEAGARTYIMDKMKEQIKNKSHGQDQDLNQDYDR
ncbi:MAG: hypothetical protein AAFO07_04890 [Bacteroidota bacterium]